MFYVVELVPDEKTNTKADLNRDGTDPVSFENAVALLKDFTRVNGGEFLDWHVYEQEKRVGSALVQMTEEVAKKLENVNIDLLLAEGKKSFVARLEGTLFDIFPEEGIEIFPHKDPDWALRF